MNNTTTGVPELTIGIDVGDKYCQICYLDANGEILEEARIRTSKASFNAQFEGSPARIALEEGTHAGWIARTLEAMGHEVLIANPRKLRMIYQNDSKDDRTDARMLARVARFDPVLLSPVVHKTEEQNTDFEVIKARDELVGNRTSLINHVRGTVKHAGGTLPDCSTEAFAKRCRAEIPEKLRIDILPLLETIEFITVQIRAYDKRIKKLCETSYPITGLLCQVNGVGPLTALSFVLSVGNPCRFRKSRQVGSYLGLRPRRDDSGERKSALPITKAGSSYMRRLLVGSAQYILGPFGTDCYLKRWGLFKAQGGKAAKKRAVVAVARKLAVLLHRLWRTGEVYDPLRNVEMVPSTQSDGRV